MSSLVILAIAYVTVAFLSVWLLKIGDDRRRRKRESFYKLKRPIVIPVRTDVSVNSMKFLDPSKEVTVSHKGNLIIIDQQETRDVQ